VATVAGWLDTSWRRAAQGRVARVSDLIRAASQLLLALCLASVVPIAADAQQPLHGVRFCLDTIETSATHRGPLTPVAGRVEFAAGRGRLDLLAVRHDPLTMVNGVALAPPAGRPGDYYLFSDTALVLVRPRTRTYALVRLSRVESNATPALLPDDELFRFSPSRIDTVGTLNSPSSNRTVSLKIQMHVDVLHAGDVAASVARASINVTDAPAGEASVLRWLGAARILADVGPTLRLQRGERLQLTAVVALHPTPNGPAAVVSAGHPISCLASAEIDRTRLMIPSSYRKIRWPPSRAYN
jgi:hypothetical protein